MVLGLVLLQVNFYTKAVYGEPLFPSLSLPPPCTGENIGLAYLHDQDGGDLVHGSIEDAIDADVELMDTDLDGNDEQATSPRLGAAGLQEDPSSTLPLTLVRLLQAVPFDFKSLNASFYLSFWFPSTHSSFSKQDTDSSESDGDKSSSSDDDSQEDSLDLNAIPGWQHVDHLADALLKLKGLTVGGADAATIVELYGKLMPFDKRPVLFQQRVRKPRVGRFARQKKKGHTGAEAVRR